MWFISSFTAVHVLELVLACPGACPRIVWLKVHDDEVKVYRLVCMYACATLSVCLMSWCVGAWLVMSRPDGLEPILL